MVGPCKRVHVQWCLKLDRLLTCKPAIKKKTSAEGSCPNAHIPFETSEE